MKYFELAQDRVAQEQIRLLYGSAAAPISVSIVVAVLFSWSLSGTVDRRSIVGWLVVFLLVSAGRVALLLIYSRKAPTVEQTGRYHLLFLTGAYLAACVWGSAAFVLFPTQSQTHQMVLLLVLLGVSAGSISALCASLAAATGFLSLLLGPLLLRMIMLESGESVVIALLTALFWLASLVGVTKINGSIYENIQLRLQAVEREKSLQRTEARYRHIFSSAPLGIFQYDDESVIVDCNDAFAGIIGSTRQDLIGMNMLATLQNQGVLQMIKKSLREGDGYFEGEYTSITGRKATPVRAFFKALRDDEETITGGIGIVEDFTEKKLSEQQVQYHMTYDSLTGLPNRRLLHVQLSHEISRSRRHGYHGALFFIDMDNFKNINDSLGHSVGDKVLQMVARRLTQSIRHEDIAARMGGDEFIVILTEIDRKADLTAARAHEVAEVIRYCLSLPYEIEGYQLQLTPSMGVSLFPKEGMDAEDILKQADTAMYRAKESGRNEIQFFMPDMQAAADERLRLHSELRGALEKGELLLYFQPQYSDGGTMCGAEALIRWQHPTRGLLAPGVFLQVAEDTGMMSDIDRFVLLSACRNISKWQRSGWLREGMTISVNISGRELDASGFDEMVISILQQTGAEPVYLGIEITEGSLVSISNTTIDRMRRLQNLGIRFSIDDFGTGYSSLSYLKRLPVHTLKIDRSFVSDIDTNDAVLVDTIVMLARNLGLHVIAEGVENETELDYLRRCGCAEYQGYHFSKPLPEEQFVKLLASTASVFAHQNKGIG